MSLRGKGAVAIWHDIAPEGLAEFHAWHGNEHMPERVGIPGFLRGRRYEAIDAELGFFNLYETVDAGVLTGDAYRARLNAPTPWTVATVKHFRNVARSLCAVAWTHAKADGGSIATFVPKGDVAPELLSRLAQAPGIAGVHALVADEAASGEINAEARARGVANEVPRRTILVEGWADASAFAATVRAALPGAGIYRLQISLDAPR
ncbi:MAG: hypothetical protein NBV67_08585 [Tagaea sp.]|nr:hypothetical protein [Tagaea sp.]